MANQDILQLITTAQWFNNLGNALPSTGVVPIAPNQWQRITRTAIQTDFNLSGDTGMSDFPEFEWLNEELEEAEQKLKDVAPSNGPEAECKTARLETFKLAQVSLRSASEAGLLEVGPSNLNNPARQAALLICRVAASEAAVDMVGVGCWLLGMYYRDTGPSAERKMAGHWCCNQPNHLLDQANPPRYYIQLGIIQVGFAAKVRRNQSISCCCSCPLVQQVPSTALILVQNPAYQHRYHALRTHVRGGKT